MQDQNGKNLNYFLNLISFIIFRNFTLHRCYGVVYKFFEIGHDTELHVIAKWLKTHMFFCWHIIHNLSYTMYILRIDANLLNTFSFFTFRVNLYKLDTSKKQVACLLDNSGIPTDTVSYLVLWYTIHKKLIMLCTRIHSFLLKYVKN